MRISQSSFLKTLLAVAAITLATAACAAAATLPMESSPEIPAAEGRVHMKLARNQNTQIDLVVKHLAPPDRIAPGTSVFIVWVRGLPLGSKPQSMGALRVNKDLGAKMRFVTALKAFDLFLTCEAIQTVVEPSGKELLPVHYAGE